MASLLASRCWRRFYRIHPFLEPSGLNIHGSNQSTLCVHSCSTTSFVVCVSRHVPVRLCCWTVHLWPFTYAVWCWYKWMFACVIVCWSVDEIGVIWLKVRPWLLKSFLFVGAQSWFKRGVVRVGWCWKAEEVWGRKEEWGWVCVVVVVGGGGNRWYATLRGTSAATGGGGVWSGGR